MERLFEARIALALVAFTVAAPGVAWANSGVGFLMVTAPLLVLSLVPVILVEAVVLAIALRLPPREALMVSLRANVVSTILGIVIGFAIDILLHYWTDSSGFEATRGATSTMLVPMFAISWYLEYRSVARRLPYTRRPKIAGATAWANLISYAGMFAAAWVFLPVHSSFPLRVAVFDAIEHAEVAKFAVADFLSQTGRLPISAEELPGGAAAWSKKGITFEPPGRFSVRLSPSGLPELEGTHLVITPVVINDGDIRWDCSSPDIPKKYLPLPSR